MEQKIKELLISTNRKGVYELIKFLERMGYFKAPASTNRHYSFEGGLIKHSYSVYRLFSRLCKEFDLGMTEDSIIICSLLHDVCKSDVYMLTDSGYKYNGFIKGHAERSLRKVKQYIKLTEQEEELIKFHMGMYGTTEFHNGMGEYTLRELVKAYNENKIAKLFYFCDDMSTQFLEV